jgi:hypothetical protein
VWLSCQAWPSAPLAPLHQDLRDARSNSSRHQTAWQLVQVCQTAYCLISSSARHHDNSMQLHLRPRNTYHGWGKLRRLLQSAAGSRVKPPEQASCCFLSRTTRSRWQDRCRDVATYGQAAKEIYIVGVSIGNGVKCCVSAESSRRRWVLRRATSAS